MTEFVRETSGRYDRRNFYLNATEGAAWVAGASLISVQTVLPALVAHFGGGNVSVGSLSVIAYAGVFLPQIIAARYGQSLEWKKPWVIGYGLAQRLVLLVIGGVVLTLGSRHPFLALVLFLTLYTINQVLTGLTGPIWYDLYAKLTPIERRGRLTGVRNSLAGTVAFCFGFVLTWILSTYDFPLSYALAFFVAFILQSVSIILQSQLTEEYPSRTQPRQTMRAYIRQLPIVLRTNVRFRRFLTAVVFLILAAMPVSFYTVYALKRFHADESLVGQFTLTMVAGQVAGALLNGYLADRHGNKRALIVAAVAMLMASIVAIVAPSVDWLRLTFFLVGVNIGSEVMTRHNLAVEYGRTVDRSTYIGLMNTVLAPLYLSGILGGWLSDVFGYVTMFVTGGMFSLIGIAMLVLYVVEPRRVPSE